MLAYGSLTEDLALARLSVVELDAEAESLWGARQYRLALQRRAEAAAEREYVLSLQTELEMSHAA